jgi:hypothetical protein
MALVIEGQADFSQAQRSIDDFSKKSRIALTNLSLVVQDLPYGFIGIQNNLPALTQSFAQLSSEAGGTQNALKQIAAGLVGPAGLFLAFSAVTTAITYAVQKYGSLKEAFNALIGIAPILTESQKEYNKAVADATGNVALEEAKIKILVGTLNDLDAPQRLRIAAYNELKKVSPDVVAGIKEENALTSESIDIINKSSEARLQAIRLRIQEAGINAVLTNNAEKLATKQQELNLASKEYVSNAVAFTKAQNSTNISGQAAVQVQQSAFSAFKSSAKSVSTLLKEISNLKSEQEAYLDQLKPIVDQTSLINLGTKERIGLIKKETKAQQENTKEYPTLFEIFKKLIVIRNEFTQDSELFKYFERASKGLEKFRKDNVEVETKFKVPTTLALSPMMKQKMEELKALAQEFTNVREILTQTFFNPLQDLFTNFFETGKFAFKSFADAVLKEIQRLVARIIATGIIKLLASILVPGGAVAVAATGLKSVSTGALADFLGGGVRNPSFGGVQGGGLGMSGQVALVLRGQDLVGAINRTNTTINRVG